MAKQSCEDCKFFHCAGYHTYICSLDDEQHSPFDNVCKDFNP